MAVVYGTASLRSDWGYLVPPGRYWVTTEVPFQRTLPGVPSQALSVPAEGLTVVTRDRGGRAPTENPMTGAEFTETIAKPVRDRLRRRQVCARRRRSRRPTGPHSLCRTARIDGPSRAASLARPRTQGHQRVPTAQRPSYVRVKKPWTTIRMRTYRDLFVSRRFSGFLVHPLPALRSPWRLGRS